jgi:hypothetical protein
VIGVDPVGSVYAYFQTHGVLPPPEELKVYLIDGIGQSYVPDSYWPDVVDEVIACDDRRHTARSSSWRAPRPSSPAPRAAPQCGERARSRARCPKTLSW